MKFSFAEPGKVKAGTLVALVQSERRLGTPGAELDRAAEGALARAMSVSRFDGKKGETLSVLAPRGVDADRILLVGVGPAEKLDDQALEAVGGTIAAALAKSGATEAAVLVGPAADLDRAPAEVAARLALGARLRSYRFDKYRTKQKDEDKPSLETLHLVLSEASAASKAFAPLDQVAEGVFLTRDLVTEPPNHVYPETMAERCRALEEVGVEVEVLDGKKLRELGMGALLGVAQGSAREPRVVVMRWNGAPGGKGEAPVAFVGKGVTFDSGGISLKPGQGMEEMKWDMAGAGAVVGLMRALAGRKAKVNAVGIVGLVENMPSGTAQRPSDVVKSLSGQTIEVLNTDAEGRLVLADVLWYAQDRFKPKAMIDLATLTGAIIIALGGEHAGLFSNDDQLAEKLLAAGRGTGEKLWRMPIGDAFDKMIDSDIADVKNISGSRDAGSTIGAQFLHRFVNGVPWAHLDIAGVAWTKKDGATVPKGATGFGVRLLDRFVAETYEA